MGPPPTRSTEQGTLEGRECTVAPFLSSWPCRTVGGVGIAYVAAAFGIVPGLLFIFNRLSRPPEQRQSAKGQPERPQHEDVPFVDFDPESVADEAERWLQSQT